VFDKELQVIGRKAFQYSIWDAGRFEQVGKNNDLWCLCYFWHSEMLLVVWVLAGSDQ